MIATVTRWLLLVVLVADAAFVWLFIAGGQPASGADAAQPAAAASTLEELRSEPSRDALLALGRRLAERAGELDRRETELQELLRGAEVLRQAGLLEPAPADADEAGSGEARKRRSAAFETLQRAYANMEPDSAARALAQLAARDKQVVVELLLGWNARTSGAILDSLTQSDPGLSADLSYEIWKLGGGAERGR